MNRPLKNVRTKNQPVTKHPSNVTKAKSKQIEQSQVFNTNSQHSLTREQQ